MTSKILLVRHGQTDWNLIKRFQGHQDVPLNATGLLQAQAVANYLKDYPISHIFTSDLSRAKATAYEIWRYHKHAAFHTMRALREGYGGELEGRIFSKQIGNSEIQSLNSLRSLFPHTGETLSEIHNRILQAFEYITTGLPPDATAVIVSHGGPIRLLLGTLQGVPMQEAIVMKVANGSVSELQKIDGRWIVTIQNKKNHLLA